MCAVGALICTFLIGLLTGSNPDHDCPCLEIGFDRFTHPVSYPPEYQIDELAAWVSNNDNANSFYHRGTTAPIYPNVSQDQL